MKLFNTKTNNITVYYKTGFKDVYTRGKKTPHTTEKVTKKEIKKIIYCSQQ